MKIKLIDCGCSMKFQELLKEVFDEMKKTYDLEVLTGMEDMIAYGVMKTPALVIDDNVVLSGRIPKKEELKKLLNK